MTTTPPPPPPQEPLPLQTISPPRQTTTTTTTKPPHQIPSPWSHTETIHLITAYTQKWYSLNKGQLKATQWEHLSLILAKRCGYPSPSKTATQCRHKIEKLRKRYRAENLKPNPSSWEYFHLMHALHHGPAPALPVAMVQNPNSGYDDDKGGLVNYAPRTVRNNRSSTGFGHGVGRRSEIDEEDEEETVNLANFGCPIATARYNPNMNPIFLRRHVELDHEEDEEEVYLVSKSNNVRDQKRRGYLERSEGSESEGEEREESGLALAGEIRRFAEKVVRMEERKMEIMRETERCRMEMEKRTTEMIHESQRKVMDTIAKAFGSHDKKKMKTEMD